MELGVNKKLSLFSLDYLLLTWPRPPPRPNTKHPIPDLAFQSTCSTTWQTDLVPKAWFSKHRNQLLNHPVKSSKPCCQSTCCITWLLGRFLQPASQKQFTACGDLAGTWFPNQLCRNLAQANHARPLPAAPLQVRQRAKLWMGSTQYFWGKSPTSASASASFGISKDPIFLLHSSHLKTALIYQSQLAI